MFFAIFVVFQNFGYLSSLSSVPPMAGFILESARPHFGFAASAFFLRRSSELSLSLAACHELLI